MRSTEEENIAEHSAQVAQIAHAMAIIKNRLFGGNVNPDRVTTLALYHETGEVLTGDLPTPIKYYNPKIRSASKEIEAIANEKLLSMIPPELREDYEEIVLQNEDSYEHILVKAADKISAYAKCIEEMMRRLGEAALTLIRRENIEPQSPMAFHVYARVVKVMYRIGAAIELKRLGYKFEQVNLPNMSSGVAEC